MTTTAADIEKIVSLVIKRLEAMRESASAEEQQDAPVNQVMIDEPVISMSVLRNVNPGTRTLHVSRQAVVTPSALDWMRDHGVTLSRAESPKPSPIVASPETKTCGDRVIIFDNRIRQQPPTSRPVIRRNTCRQLVVEAHSHCHRNRRSVIVTNRVDDVASGLRQHPEIRFQVIAANDTTDSQADVVLTSPDTFTRFNGGQL